MTASIDLAEIDSSALLKALDLAASHDWARLGEHTLAGLHTVALGLDKMQLPDNAIGRGKMLGALLKQAVGRLAPGPAAADSMPERVAQILRARLDGIHPKAAAHDMGLSVDRWYALQRDEALPKLRAALWEMEQEARQSEIKRRLLRNVPSPTYSRLFGVDEKLERMAEALMDPEARWLISLEGMGGIGKTALAHASVTWAAGQVSRFRDIAWVTAQQQIVTWQTVRNLRRPALTFESLLDLIASQMGFSEIPKMEAGRKEASLRVILKSTSYLIVVDNLETAIDYEGVADKLWTLANPSKILLTSRHRLTDYEHVYSLLVNQLTDADGLAFIRYHAHERGLTEIEAAGDRELLEVQHICGGNPLAIRLVLGQATSLALPQILSAMQAAQPATEHLYRYLYWHSWELLSDPARVLLVRMPLLPPSGGDWADLAALTQFPEDRLRQAVAELTEKSLLNAIGTQSKVYTLHSLTRHFVMSEIVKEAPADDLASSPDSG